MTLTKLAVACALTGALVACGGGGGGSAVDAGGSGGGSGAGTTRTLAGVAAKGLIKNGIVRVFSYDANGQKSAQPLATTRTSTIDGSYSVDLGSNIGLFTIEVSADAATTMADEVGHTDIPMPVGLTLRSLVQLDSAAGTAINGYVTPFTDMLVNAAESAGGLTTANVAAAQSGVIKMLGFDPRNTKPLDADSTAATAATDTAEQLQSLALAALSRLAHDGSLGCAQATISEKIKCVIETATRSASLQEGKLSMSLATQVAIRDALAAVAADKTVNKTRLDTLDGQTTFSQASVSTSSTVENPIAAAKALFASLRSNIQAWSDAGGNANNSANALKADFDAAIAPVDQSLTDWMLLSESGVGFFNAYIAGKTGNTTAIFRTQSDSLGPYPNPLGGCTVYADTNFVTPAKAPSEARSVSCSLTPTSNYVSGINDQNGYSYIVKGMTKAITLMPISGSTTKFTYKSRARVDTTQYTYTWNNTPPYTTTSTSTLISRETVGDYGSAGSANGTISLTMSGAAVTGATISGFMPARTNDAGVALTDQEAWNVSYARTLEADNVTTKYALSGDITAFKGGVAVGTVALQDGSFIRAIAADGVLKVQNVKQVNLALAVISKESKVVGTLSLDAFSADKKGANVIPTNLKFIGSFNHAGAEFFNGTLTANMSNYANYDSNALDSAQNFLKAGVSFSGVARVPGRPDLSLTLGARTIAFESFAYTAQYDDGTNAILISSSSANPKELRIASSNGVSIQLKDGVNKVDVMKNSSKIASYDRGAWMLNYADGSFESLK